MVLLFLGSLRSALIVILTEGGVTTSWQEIRPSIRTGALLATVGVGVGVLAMTLMAHYWLGLSWQLAVLLAAVTAPTDAAAVFSVLRRVPLMRVEHDGVYAAVASRGGAPEHPRWYYNVKRNPHVELQDGTETGAFVAREVSGEEKDVWWERAVAAYPNYAVYQRRTDREIPLFVLEPA